MNNKKIATLTFHRAINYGAVLQCYALQKSIEKSGCDTEVLDYRSAFLEKLHNPHNISKYKSILHFGYSVLKNRVKKDNRKAFRDFSEKNLKLSKKYSRESIKSAADEYKAFIVGSDQVWNHKCTDFDRTYFLDFLSDKSQKYSYAASIGIKLDDEKIRGEYKSLLSDFSVLSVREEQAQKELNILGLSSEVALDPTLLLTGDEWRTLEEKPKMKIGKYVLVYVITATPSVFEAAEKIAEKYGLQIVYINEFLFNRRGVKNISKITPNEWLWLFDNAEYIVTNSFHGTAFSINFNKQFYVEPLPVKTNVNSRIFDLLGLLNLQSRVVEGADDVDFANIDYENVDLENHREHSLALLEKTLSLINGV